MVTEIGGIYWLDFRQ